MTNYSFFDWYVFLVSPFQFICTSQLRREWCPPTKLHNVILSLLGPNFRRDLYIHMKSTYMWPSMHKLTLHRKVSKSRLFTSCPFYRTFTVNGDVFFSIQLIVLRFYDVSMIQLKRYISGNVRSQFRNCTPLAKSPRTNRFIFDEYIQSLWTKVCQKVGSGG